MSKALKLVSLSLVGAVVAASIWAITRSGALHEDAVADRTLPSAAPLPTGPVAINDDLTFAPRPLLTNSAMVTASDAFSRFSHGKPPAFNSDVQFGTITMKLGNDHVVYRDRRVWAFSTAGLCYPSEVASLVPYRCRSWMFLDATTGRHLLSTAEQELAPAISTRS